MSFYLNGVECDTLYLNGTECDDGYLNGTEVFTAATHQWTIAELFTSNNHGYHKDAPTPGALSPNTFDGVQVNKLYVDSSNNFYYSPATSTSNVTVTLMDSGYVIPACAPDTVVNVSSTIRNYIVSQLGSTIAIRIEYT